MLRQRLFWPILLVAALATCSDDDNNNGKDKDAGGDSTAVTEAGTPDTKPTPDITPDVNTSLKPKIDQMLPTDGFANATTKVVLTGKNFAQGARVYLDGGAGAIIMNVTVSSPVSLAFVMPKNPYGAPDYDKPQKVSVSVLVNTMTSNAVDFQYTVSQEMDAKFKGSVLTASTDAFKDFASDPIEAQVYVEGITDTTTGDSQKITAQIGYGPEGKDPSKEDGWKWFKARFKEDSTAQTGYDVYDGTLKVPLVKTYDVAFRFSQDGGQTWIYADTDEGDLKYDTAKSAKLKAAQAPVNYCQTDGDCSLNAFAVVCMVDAADKTKNQCVECLQDSDCTGHPKALGPTCLTTKNLCICNQASDCAKNPNGLQCLSSYCGCNGDDDCKHVSGTKCTQDPQTKLQLCM
jgi:hypothetical protein